MCGLGIYDATGPSGGPGAKEAETNAFATTTGWIRRTSLRRSHFRLEITGWHFSRTTTVCKTRLTGDHRKASPTTPLPTGSCLPPTRPRRPTQPGLTRCMPRLHPAAPTRPAMSATSSSSKITTPCSIATGSIGFAWTGQRRRQRQLQQPGRHSGPVHLQQRLPHLPVLQRHQLGEIRRGIVSAIAGAERRLFRDVEVDMERQSCRACRGGRQMPYRSDHQYRVAWLRRRQCAGDYSPRAMCMLSVFVCPPADTQTI